tara:strand:- start:145 stop:1014 length:870 start_codon:yes stop_codon:yes gene_type:complete
MIIVDLNQIMISNLMVQINGRNAVELSEDLVRHMVLNSLRGINKKFRKDYGELVIASDGKHSWRKQIFPNYKANRKKNREQSGHDWETIFDVINRIKSELKEFMPYKLLEVETAEADDVIAVLIRKMERIVGPNHAKKILIVSGDKDFIQLHNEWVKQYNPILNKYVGKDETPSIYIKEHILKGDRSDGVPNILSDDNVFVEGRRQRPLSKKRINELICAGFLYTSLNDEEQKNYDRNQKLIDLTYIPQELEEKIKSEFDNIKVATRDKILNYFISRKLKTLIEVIDEF